MSLTARKILITTLFLLLSALPACAATLPPAPPFPASEDVPSVHVLPTGHEKIRICVLSVCEEDPALEAAIKRAAESALLRLKGVAVSDILEESSVLVSFAAFKERDAQGMQTGRIVYSFAYGTPDLDYADGVLIALPRYLNHEPVLATRETLERKIADNVEEADRDFFRFLRIE